MTDDSQNPPTGQQPHTESAGAMLLGAAAWGALAWLERRQQRRAGGVAPPTSTAAASMPAPTGPALSRPGPPTRSPAQPVRAVEEAVVVRNEADIPYRVPITAGGITVDYAAGSLGKLVTWSAVTDGPAGRRAHPIFGPVNSLEEVRSWLRATGWTPVHGARSERWRRQPD